VASSPFEANQGGIFQQDDTHPTSKDLPLALKSYERTKGEAM